MQKQILMRFLLSCFLMLLGVSQLAYADLALRLDDKTDYLDISSEYLHLLEDSRDSLSINEITTNYSDAFEGVESGVINQGHSASSFWVRFNIKDLSEGRQPWILEISYPLLKRVNIYVVSENQIVEQHQLGYSMPILERQIPNRLFAQPLRFEHGKDYQVYVNVMRKNGSIQIPLKLYSAESYLLHQIKSNYVFGMFFGIMLAMIIYNSYLFFAVGNKAYLYYIFYIATVSCAFLTTTGYGFLFVWGGFPSINEYALQIPSLLASIAGTLFLRHFIGVGYFSKVSDRLISVAVAVGFFLLALRLSTNYFLSETITLYVSVISVVAPGIAFYCYQKGSRPAGFFLVGWSALFVGILFFTSSMLGLMPVNTFTANGVLIGAAMETLLLSLGLADRINTERRKKYDALQAQHESAMQLQETENRLMHHALHNIVTGLPNRTFLRTVLEGQISDRMDERFVIVLINLNNFHEINKTLGHSNGDSVLYLVTQRINLLCSNLSGVVPLEETDSRVHYLAGVEGITFAVVMQGCALDQAKEVVSGLLRELEKPIGFQGLSLDIDVSAGLSSYPQHGSDCESLIRNAHIALESASKSNEKIAAYSAELDPYNPRRISLIGELRQAIEQDQLQIYFQPQVALKDGVVRGAEVLVRWIHPEYGFIPPDEFIPLAERTGVIHSLTYWICAKVFGFISVLEQQGYGLDLSINISARNLQDPGFKRKIVDMAKDQGVALASVVMELTETAIMLDPEYAMQMMRELNSAGIRLSIDDFGTGYSSLSYLKRLPVNELKIDRSFVMEMAQNTDDQLLIKSTLDMGHNFNMTVVAEGIEDEPTLLLLREMGCDLAQGYHIARPMPGEDFLNWLSQYEANRQSSIAS